MIEKSDDHLTIKLNSVLYDKGCVDDAFEELKKEVRAVKTENEDYFEIRIDRKSEDAESYCYEFLNFVLKLMKNNGIV